MKKKFSIKTEISYFWNNFKSSFYAISNIKIIHILLNFHRYNFYYQIQFLLLHFKKIYKVEITLRDCVSLK